MVLTNKANLAEGAGAAQAEAPPVPRGPRRFLLTIRSARGFLGGLAAIGLAVLGQWTLLSNNSDAAFLYYLAAFIVLIASLHRRSLPTRRVRPNGAAAPDSGSQSAGGESASARPAWSWGEALAWRARLNQRVTLAGLGSTLVLAAFSAFVLIRNITDPLGGWLWAAALLTLLFTFLGTEPRPLGKGLLPSPEGDAFAPGSPLVPRRLEMALVAITLLVAAGMRLYDLENMPGIFGDEGERGVTALGIVQGGRDNLFGYGWWGVPNMYFYLVSFMLHIFGTNMVGDRMLSVVSGLLGVFYVYRVGRLLWGPRAGLLAGAMLAVSPLALQFSRLAGESTPTGTLWTVGFFYFILALRFRRWSDWLLTGLAWGFSLYFYAAGKLVFVLFGLVALFCLVRWRRDFFKRYALGFALALLAFALVFMPHGIFSAKDNWQNFTGRAQETSIVSPQNAPQVFSRYGIPYDGTTRNGSFVSGFLSQPLPWALVLFNQLRVTTEVLYRSGDPTVFYAIREHGGSMLPPLLAALTLLGLAYSTWKSWDARFGLVNIWFWVGVLGPALTIDTPSVQRLVCAWPAVMLFPAVILDRVFAAASPLSPSLARRWAAAPLVLLLIVFSIDGYREYFIHYRSLCPYCTSTTQARYVQGLGTDYKVYQMGVGDSLVPIGYGSTRFVAGEVEGMDLAAPADTLPLIDGASKGAAFIIYPENYAYLPLVRLFYPGGLEEQVRGTDGSEQFVSYKLSAQQLGAAQTLSASYLGQSGTVIARDEPNLGTERALDGLGALWSPPEGLLFPAIATWEGGLIATSYGRYTFTLDGAGEAELEIDGEVRLHRGAAAETGQQSRVELVLAKGLHRVRLRGTLHDGAGRIKVGWAIGGAQATPIEARFFFRGSTGGLSGEIRPDSGSRVVRRSDPFFGFQEATQTLGNEPFTALWRGRLLAPTTGVYTFETISNGASELVVDGKAVTANRADNMVVSASGEVVLGTGEHEIELRYTWRQGPARLLLYWTPPGLQREIVPPTSLSPAVRSWTPEEVPNAPNAEAVPGAPQEQAPEAVLGSDAGLSNPRGLAVDRDGNIYVGDRGNRRVVVFSPEGNVLRTWGERPAGGEAALQPGEFDDIVDVAVAEDNRVYVMDYGAQRVQIFDTEGRLLRVVDSSVLQTCAANGIGAAQDDLLMACTSTSAIARLDVPVGDSLPVISLLPSGIGAARLEQPLDAAANRAGQIYAIDLNDRLVQLEPDGRITTYWSVQVGTSEGGSRLALAPDDSRAYVSDPDTGRVGVIDLGTGAVSYFGAPGAAAGQFGRPGGIAVGQDGSVFVLDRVDANVQIFDLEK